MKEGDIVRVVKPRPKMGGVFIDILNEVGWIEEIKELDGVQWAQLQTLRLNGDVGGGGGVPLDCLAPEPAPEWRAAKDRRDAYIEKLTREGLERGKRLKARIASVAEKYGVAPEVAEKIVEELASEYY